MKGSDEKGLWSVFWRCLLFIIMLPVRIFLLFPPLFTVILPPVVAVPFFINDDTVTGLAITACWLAWMFVGRRIRKKIYALIADGSEYARI